MKIKSIFSIIAFISLVVGMFACKEPIPEVELENFMYLSLNGARNNPNIKKLNLSHRDTVYNISISYSGTTNYNRGNIQASIEPDFALLSLFNSENETEYLPMPVEAFSFNSNTAAIADGKNSSEPLKLTVIIDKIDPYNEYLLPVTIQSVSGTDLSLHEEYKTLYLIFVPDINNENNMDLWLCGGASSNEEMVANLFDNKSDTYWQSDENANLPQWFIVDMASHKKIDGFTLANVKDPGKNALPKRILFETSINNTDWQTVLEVDELSQSRVEQVLPMQQTVIARYIRVTVLSTWNNAPYTCLTKINVYSGEEPDLGEQDIEMKNWTIIEVSSQWNQGDFWVAKNCIDPNLNTCWHTDPFNSGANGMPQWVAVDMKKNLKITGFIFANRQDDPGAASQPKRIRFDVSNNASTWTTALIVEEVPNMLGLQEFSCPAPVSARYFKLIVESVWVGGDWTYVAFVSIY